MTPEKVIIGNAELWCGDCREVLPMLGRVDALITDPPYGIKRDKGLGVGRRFNGFSSPPETVRYERIWDNERPSKECFDLMLAAASVQIIFGGNLFADMLPVSNHWIVWDKLTNMPSFGDCELIWTNVKRNSVKKVTVEWAGLMGKEAARYHATQKPVKVMAYCVNGYTEPGQTVLDPFMGSGTTGVAAMQLGRKFVGIELDSKYFDIAVERIENSQRQSTLFTPTRKATNEQIILPL